MLNASDKTPVRRIRAIFPPTGYGNSLRLMVEVARAVQAAKRVLYVSPELSNEVVLARLGAAGVDLAGGKEYLTVLHTRKVSEIKDALAQGSYHEVVMDAVACLYDDRYMDMDGLLDAIPQPVNVLMGVQCNRSASSSSASTPSPLLPYLTEAFVLTDKQGDTVLERPLDTVTGMPGIAQTIWRIVQVGGSAKMQAAEEAWS